MSGGAHARGLAGDVLRVLDRDRDAEQGAVVAGAAAAVRLSGVGERALGHHGAKGVQLRVEPLDPGEAELDQLARGDLATANQLRLAHDAGEGELFRIHARNLSAR